MSNVPDKIDFIEEQMDHSDIRVRIFVDIDGSEVDYHEINNPDNIDDNLGDEIKTRILNYFEDEYYDMITGRAESLGHQEDL
jgi:hypothetical protein